jgi:hypothetical protein
MTSAERKKHEDRMAQIHAEARRIVAAGKCPECGSGLRRNLALAGWWQCACYGRDDFRAPEYRGKPDCNFQCFTE